MTLPLLTLPTENGQIHIYVNALPPGDAAIATPSRRRPLLLTTCALLLVGGGYVLRGITSAPAEADTLASPSGPVRLAAPQPPLPNTIPPSARYTSPRPYDHPSFASGLLPEPRAAAPSASTPGMPPPAATPAPPTAAAPAASPFGLR